MIKSIIKRDGRVVLYDEGKIASAILKAMEAAQEGDASQAAAVANAVEAALEERCGAQPPQIEQIQDEVESQLMQMGFDNAAKKYILYRASRTRVREMNTRLMKVFDELTHADATASDMKRSNANIDGDTPMGTMLQYGSEAAKDYYDKYLLTPEQSRAHREGWIHIHDFDFYALTTTCCQIDLLKLFKGGFSTGHGFLREPNDIQSYSALACIAIQSNQNDQHGGQSIVNFDYGLAPGVAKTYKKQYAVNIFKSLELLAPEAGVTLQQVKDTLRAIEAEQGLRPQLATDMDYLRPRDGSPHSARGRRHCKKSPGIRAERDGKGDRKGYLSGHGGAHSQPEYHAFPRRCADAVLVHQLRHRHQPRGPYGDAQRTAGHGRGPGPR